MQLRIKELREARDWNQTVLAYHAGLSTSQISLIETGKRNPTLETLEGIATALGVDIIDLFPKVVAPSPEPEQGRRYLSALLNPQTKLFQELSETYGPHLRLLPPAPPYEELKLIYSWVSTFVGVCNRMDRILRDNPPYAEWVDPWLERINKGNEAVPDEIRKTVRDFYAASDELFGNLVPLAEEWIAAQRERLPDAELTKLNAELGYSPEERKDAAAQDV